MEITTPNRYIVEVKDYLSEKDKCKLQEVIKQNVEVDDNDEVDIKDFTNLINTRDDILIKLLVISVNGDKNADVSEMRVADYKYLLDKLNKFSDYKDRLEKVKDLYWHMIRIGKGKVNDDLSICILCDYYKWSYNEAMESPAWFIDFMRFKMNIDNRNNKK